MSRTLDTQDICHIEYNVQKIDYKICILLNLFANLICIQKKTSSAILYIYNFSFLIVCVYNYIV